MEIQHLLAIQDSPLALSATTVLSTFLNLELHLLSTEIDPPHLPPRSTAAVLTENQLPFLAKLRLAGFSGAVLVLSQESFTTLKRQYPILRAGQGSHDACPAPWHLPDLLNRVTKLVPLERENLEILQHKLAIPRDWLQQAIIPHLQQLRQPDCNVPQELQALENIVQQLRQQTPDVCHYEIVVGSRGQKQIQFHTCQYFV